MECGLFGGSELDCCLKLWQLPKCVFVLAFPLKACNCRRVSQKKSAKWSWAHIPGIPWRLFSWIRGLSTVPKGSLSLAQMSLCSLLRRFLSKLAWALQRPADCNWSIARVHTADPRRLHAKHTRMLFLGQLRVSIWRKPTCVEPARFNRARLMPVSALTPGSRNHKFVHGKSVRHFTIQLTCFLFCPDHVQGSVPLGLLVRMPF